MFESPHFVITGCPIMKTGFTAAVGQSPFRALLSLVKSCQFGKKSPHLAIQPFVVYARERKLSLLLTLSLEFLLRSA